LLNELREWKVLQPLTERGENLVFPNGVGSIDDSSNLRNRGLHPACRAAGVEEIRWHDLRHFFASILLYDLKEPDPVICELMGHSNIAFTHQIYGHWMTDARRDAEIASRLSLAFGGE
jgi:integrase